jgi:hypothetical protein
MTGWQALGDELARWQDDGRTPDLWWRDDDAVDASAALDRLIEIHRTTGAPLALAVVPAQATPVLAERLAGEPGIDVLQHGYAHIDHATATEKKIELGLQRPAMLVLGELGTGWLAMERLFGRRALSVLVPPWNRIAPALVPTLPEIGYRGLSTFGSRRRAEPVRGLRQINTHVDLVDWKGGRGFVGEEMAIDSLLRALIRARSGDGEPVGLLSHHLAMDDRAWDFLRSFWQGMTTMSGLRVRSAHELFAREERG